MKNGGKVRDLGKMERRGLQSKVINKYMERPKGGRESNKKRESLEKNKLARRGGGGW